MTHLYNRCFYKNQSKKDRTTEDAFAAIPPFEKTTLRKEVEDKAKKLNNQRTRPRQDQEKIVRLQV
jgi:hypothetical protein